MSIVKGLLASTNVEKMVYNENCVVTTYVPLN